MGSSEKASAVLGSQRAELSLDKLLGLGNVEAGFVCVGFRASSQAFLVAVFRKILFPF